VFETRTNAMPYAPVQGLAMAVALVAAAVYIRRRATR
jgi:hypothetical protein